MSKQLVGYFHFSVPWARPARSCLGSCPLLVAQFFTGHILLRVVSVAFVTSFLLQLTTSPISQG